MKNFLQNNIANFFNDSNTSINDLEILSVQKEEVKLELALYLKNNVDKLNNQTQKIIQLLDWLYSNENQDKVICICKFVEDTKHYECLRIFAKNDEISGLLKNKYTSDIIEQIRFSKLQKESLRDTSTYNRHIAKSLMFINHGLTCLLELTTGYEELEPIFEKYYFFTRFVNIPQCWIDFYELKKYNSFQKFVDNKKAE